VRQVVPDAPRDAEIVTAIVAASTLGCARA
jgi:hypothetical protein